jgi:prepilin signal peptidase PulO-like enzyme (type II secretory pathway)
VLWAASRGRVVGAGDVLVGTATGAVLGWRAALLALAIANVLALAVIAVATPLGRRDRADPVPMAPFLAIGFVVVALGYQASSQ